MVFQLLKGSVSIIYVYPKSTRTSVLMLVSAMELEHWYWAPHGESLLLCRTFYSRFSCSNEYGILCLCKKDQLLSLKAINLRKTRGKPGGRPTDRLRSLCSIYLQFVDRNICQVKNPSLTVGQCLWIQQWEDTIICVP